MWCGDSGLLLSNDRAQHAVAPIARSFPSTARANSASLSTMQEANALRERHASRSPQGYRSVDVRL